MSRIFFSTFLKFSSGGGRLPEAGRRLERAERRRRAGTRESMVRGAASITPHQHACNTAGHMAGGW